MRLSLADLSERSGVPGRSIRFYIQRGLLPPPHGAKRGAYYDDAHLSGLLRIREWQDTGLSLDAIAQLIAGASGPTLPPARVGSVVVRSHLVVAEGIELVVSPDQAGLGTDQVRRLFRAVQQAYSDLTRGDAAPPQEAP